MEKPTDTRSNPVTTTQNRIPSNKVFVVLGVMIMVVSFFTVGFIFGRETKANSTGIDRLISPGSVTNSSPDGSVDMTLFWNVWNTLKDNYVDSTKASNSKAMYYGAIKGFVNAYADPATLFLTPTETTAFNKQNTGSFFAGIGAELGYNSGSIAIVAPIKGSPAANAGLRPGDIIYKVDSVEVKSSETVEDVVAKIRGEVGTTVKLSIIRKGETKALEFSIVRGAITISSSTLKKVSEQDSKITDLDSSVALVDLTRFTEDSVETWNSKWDAIVTQIVNGKYKGVIFDLRNDPGGFFDAAVHAANDFLPTGAIISKQQDRQGNIEQFKADGSGRLKDIKIVVLVNEGSASASEIFAGALKGNNRATIVGMKTYGKGTAQAVLPLTDGSSLHITVSKWLLPDGSWLNRDNPITPDVVVDLTNDDFKAGIDPQFKKAVETMRNLIK
jgi:carboxyl-terminal processing protease